MKPLLWRPAAERDVEEVTQWFAAHGGLSLGEDFITEVETALETIGQHPDIGSTRHAQYLPDLPAPLRFLTLKRFDSYLVYYINLPQHIEVIRVWSTARGLEALMASAKD